MPEVLPHDRFAWGTWQRERGWGSSLLTKNPAMIESMLVVPYSEVPRMLAGCEEDIRDGSCEANREYE